MGGFSLVELLIVVALIVIMFTMYFSSSSINYQNQQKRKCEKNLQTIYTGLKTYAIDNNDLFPTLAGAQTSEPVLSQLVPRYTTGTEFFTCPGGKDGKLPDAQPFADKKISYAYYMGRNSTEGTNSALLSDHQVNTAPKAQGEPLFSADGKKPGNNHNKYGGNVMFCDGSVRSSAAQAEFPLSYPTNVILLNPKL